MFQYKWNNRALWSSRTKVRPRAYPAIMSTAKQVWKSATIRTKCCERNWLTDQPGHVCTDDNSHLSIANFATLKKVSISQNQIWKITLFKDLWSAKKRKKLQSVQSLYFLSICKIKCICNLMTWFQFLTSPFQNKLQSQVISVHCVSDSSLTVCKGTHPE